MRSALPKVLHPLCGRPLILWPVRGRQEAGAGKVVVVDSPKRRLEDRLPEGVEIAIQQSPTAPATRSPPAAEHIDADATVVVLYGDVPLITRRGDQRARRRPRGRAARRRRWPRWSSTTRPTTAASCATGEGNVERVVETKAGGRRDARAARDPRGQHRRSTRSTAPACSRRWSEIDADNAQGELYLPDVLPMLREAGQDDRRRTWSPTRRSRSASTTASSSRRSASSPSGGSTSAHARNGVTIVDPASTQIDADVDDRPRHVIEPGTFLKGATTIGDGLRGSARSRRSSTASSATASRVPHSYLVQARVDDFGTIGPFAYLRPDAHLHPKRQGRRVRRDQELEHRRGHEGPAPVLHRRRRRRREHEHRRGQHHRQLRRPATSTARRSGRTSRRAWTPRSSRPSRSATARTPERVA